MAFIERYVTSAAGGGGIGTEGDPWTLAEASANAAAGDRVNVKSDAGYNIAAVTVANAGTTLSRLVFRGYNSTIGDLENQGRNSDGSLNLTNFPVITVSGSFKYSNYSIFQNIYMTGSIADLIFDGDAPDQTVVIGCKFENTASSSAAKAATGDSNASFINCDFECTATTHGNIFESDDEAHVAFCRFIGNTSAAVVWCTIRKGAIVNSVCINKGTQGDSKGFVFETGGTARQICINNTCYNMGVDFSLSNSAQTTGMVLFINSHYTDSGTGINNPYSGTADQFIIEVNSRTRDNTTNRIGLGDSLNIGEVTTDTGGPETDYVDAPNGDITLIAAAPAVNAGSGM